MLWALKSKGGPILLVLSFLQSHFRITLSQVPFHPFPYTFRRHIAPLPTVPLRHTAPIFHMPQDKTEVIVVGERAGGGGDQHHHHHHHHHHKHGHHHSHGHNHDHKHGHDHKHDHGHNHKHDHGHSHNHKHDHGHSHNHKHGHKHAHKHQHGHGHNHDHGHSHDHNHKHDHQHNSVHNHGHQHSNQHQHNHQHAHNNQHQHQHNSHHQHQHNNQHDHQHSSHHQHQHNNQHHHQHNNLHQYDQNSHPEHQHNNEYQHGHNNQHSQHNNIQHHSSFQDTDIDHSPNGEPHNGYGGSGNPSEGGWAYQQGHNYKELYESEDENDNKASKERPDHSYDNPPYETEDEDSSHGKKSHEGSSQDKDDSSHERKNNPTALSLKPGQNYNSLLRQISSNPLHNSDKSTIEKNGPHYRKEQKHPNGVTLQYGVHLGQKVDKDGVQRKEPTLNTITFLQKSGDLITIGQDDPFLSIDTPMRVVSDLEEVGRINDYSEETGLSELSEVLNLEPADDYKTSIGKVSSVWNLFD